jgi:PPM family protein phosphatase
MHLGGLTDTGRRREANEDSLFTDPERGLIVVADGLGGANAGKLASQLAAEYLPEMITTIEESCLGMPTDWRRQKLLRAVVVVSHRIRDRAKGRPELKGMGTTIIMALISEGCAEIVHLGHSRAYLIAGEAITRLTEDHTIANILLDSGEITKEEAARHPGRNELTRFAGMDSDPRPVYRKVNLPANGHLLLCSDGLNRHLSDHRIAQIVNDADTTETACQALIDKANERGGKDNITVAISA